MDRELFAPDQMWAMYQPALLAVARGSGHKLAGDHGQAYDAFVARRELTRIDGSYRAAVRDGVGVISVFGPLWGRWSYELLAHDFALVADDPSVRSIVINFDSPGGLVTGTSDLAELIYQARGAKRITAYVSGLGASAAYWLASAADEIVIADTGEVGSLGVMALFTDWSKFDERVGIEEIAVISSQTPDKNRPVTEDAGRALVQARVDELARVFLSSVARNRGVSFDVVMRDYGRGDLLVGQQAVDSGLADRVGSFEALLSELSISRTGGGAMTIQSPALKPGNLYRAGDDGSLVEVAAAELAQADQAAAQRATEEAVTAAVAAERARIAAVMAVSEPGAEDLLATAIADGQSAEQFALALVKRSREMGTSLGAQQADGSRALPHAGPAAPPTAGQSWDGPVARVAQRFGMKRG